MHLLWVTVSFLALGTSLSLTTTTLTLCQNLSEEGLEIIFISLLLTERLSFKLARLLSSEFFDFQRLYDRIVEEERRRVQLAALMDYPELHSTVLSVGKLGFNEELANLVLSEDNYPNYKGLFNLNHFIPAQFDFAIRLRLIQLMKLQYPAVMTSFAWADGFLLQSLNARESLVILIALWDMIDHRTLGDLIETFPLELEVLGRHLQVTVFSCKDHDLLFLRVLQLARSAKQEPSRRLYYDDSPSSKTAMVFEFISTELEESILTKLQDGGHAALRDILLRDVKSDKVRIMATNIALMMLLEDSDSFLLNPLWEETLLTRISPNDVIPALHNDLCEIFERAQLSFLWLDCPASKLAKFAKWRLSNNLVFGQRLQRHRQKVETDKDQVISFQQLLFVLRSIPWIVVLNYQLRRPVRIHESFPPTNSLLELMEQAMTFINTSAVLFGQDEERQCWLIDSDLSIVEVYAIGILHSVAIGRATDHSLFLPITKDELTQEDPIYKAILRRMCKTINQSDPNTTPSAAGEIADRFKHVLQELIGTVGLDFIISVGVS